MKVISVNFIKNKKPYYFKCSDDISLNIDDYVIVETSRGIEYAMVINDDVQGSHIAVKDMMPVVRKATHQDRNKYEENQLENIKAINSFKTILDSFPDLEMKVVEAQYNLDRSRLLFIYISDDRVDFRELLKVLANTFRTRIELKQIGARDKAKLIGGLGPCGMETCCTRFLKDFDNISINMAKNQFLSLNPTKISGLCGRLLCCLNYENKEYVDSKKLFPKIGTLIDYKDSKYRVSGVNIISAKVKLENYNNVIFVDKEELKW